MPIYRPEGQLGLVLGYLEVYAEVEVDVIERVRRAQRARDGLGGAAAEEEYQKAREVQHGFYVARDSLREQARVLGASEKDIRRLGIPASRIRDFE